MKRIAYIAVIALLLTACKGKSKITTTTTDENGNKTTTQVDVKDLSTIQQTANDMKNKVDELKKLAPMDLDALKAMVPEELAGLKRSSFSATKTLGYSSVEGDYKKDDTTSIKVALIDCAGEAGSAMYGLMYFTRMNYETENDNGYTKSIDFMGGKAVVDVKKDQNMSSLVYFGNDRLLVTLTGHNMSIDDLKSAAQQLNIKAN